MSKLKNITKVISMFLAILTIIQLLPLNAFATSSDGKPIIYEEYGFINIEIPADILNNGIEKNLFYKLGDGEWQPYTEPFEVVALENTTVSAKIVDSSGTVKENSIPITCKLGEFTYTFSDIVVGDGILPVNFYRYYSSADGWFFPFQTNITETYCGYIFADFQGEKTHYIVNTENKYVDDFENELTVDATSTAEKFILHNDGMEMRFSADGKISKITTDIDTFVYTWSSTSLVITDNFNTNCNIQLSATGKPIAISITRRVNNLNTKTETKTVSYNWNDVGNLISFVDVGGTVHHYNYIPNDEDLLLNAFDDISAITYSEQKRVKKIEYTNGAFVKYTYNDNAVNPDNTGNKGAVTVSDSRGVTDTFYYADGFAFDTVLDENSTTATYAPANISSTITTDSISYNSSYVKAYPEDETQDTTPEKDAGDNSENGTDEIDFTPLYIESGINDYTFFNYDDNDRVIAEVRVSKDDLQVTDETTFAQAEAVAYKKTTTAYDANDNIIDTTDYLKNPVGILKPSKKVVNTYNANDTLATTTEYEYVGDTQKTKYSASFTYNNYGFVTRICKNHHSSAISTYIEETIYNCWNYVIGSGLFNEETVYAASVTYNAHDLVTSVSESGLYQSASTTTYAYDSQGHVISESNTDTGTTTYVYDNYDRLISKTMPSGAVATYTYDNFGNLTEHNFNGYTFTYNTLGGIMSVKASSVNSLVAYTYLGGKGLDVQTATYGNGDTTEYIYNEDEQLTAIKVDGTTKYSYSYLNQTDENGEITKEWLEITDAANSIKKVYEDSKLTVSALNGNELYSVETSSNKGVNSTVTTIGSNTYALDSAENTDVFKLNQITLFEKTSDFSGDIINSTSIGNIDTTYGYRDDGKLNSLKNELANENQEYQYVYYNDNIFVVRLTKKSPDDGSVTSFDETFYYYTGDRKILNILNGDDRYDFEYDSRGNLTAEKFYDISEDANGNTVYTLDPNRTITYTYSDTWQDVLTSYNGQTITYDAVGNPLSYLGHNLTWDNGRQLESFDNITYTYDENGIRTSKTSNGVTTSYYLNGTQVIEQTDGTTTLHFYYDSNGDVVGFRYNGSDYLYVRNHQGDITDITDISGNIIATYEYDAWGKIVSVTGSNLEIANLNPFRYRGYYYDTDIGMYYLQSRYYDPQIRRFINCDDVRFIGVTGNEATYNPFSYCLNNPLSYIDPYGFLTSFGEIHRYVINDIKLRYPNLQVSNVKILYSNGKYGYCDIINTRTGEIWELKRVTVNMHSAENQLRQYVNGRYYHDLDLELTKGGDLITANSFLKNGYDISYWNVGNGIILYDYEKHREPAPQPELVRQMSLMMVLVVFLLGMITILTKGATLPVLLPLLPI